MKTISEDQLKQICRAAQKKVGLMVCDKTEKHYTELSRAIVEATLECMNDRYEYEYEESYGLKMHSRRLDFKLKCGVVYAWHSVLDLENYVIYLSEGDIAAAKPYKSVTGKSALNRALFELEVKAVVKTVLLERWKDPEEVEDMAVRISKCV